MNLQESMLNLVKPFYGCTFTFIFCGSRRLFGFVFTGLLIFSSVSYAQIPADKLHHLNIPRTNAAAALNLLAQQTDTLLLFPYERAKLVKAKPIIGRYNLSDALEQILTDTGLVGKISANGMINIIALSPSKTSDKPALTDNINTLENNSQQVKEAIEVITIKGIRSSMVKSFNHKRFSNDIIDTIDAEEMGKFPDANIAESLQRIAGISIDRSGGEGQFVTIRGLGPEFNTVLVNGRNIASTTGSRAFSLDTLSSEMNSSIDVYKSSNAQLSEGGLGGTIDIQTSKPFEQTEFFSVLNVKGLYSNSSNKVEPQLSFLMSDQFLDNKLGLLAGVNYQQRSQVNSSVRNFVNNHGSLVLEKGPHWQEMLEEDIAENTEVGLTSPQSLDRDVMSEYRERTGINLVAQYQASPNLVVTADALYSQFDLDAKGYSANNWFWYPTGVEVDEHNSVVWLQHGASGFATAYRERVRPTKLSVLGFNADWSISDNFSLNVDVFHSNAVNENKGDNKDIIVELLSDEYVEYDYRHGGDYPFLNQPEHTIASDDNAHLLLPKRVEFRGLDVDATNQGAKFDFVFSPDFSHTKAIHFGLHVNENEKKKTNYQVAPEVSDLYAIDARFNQLYIPESLISVGSLNGNWQGINDSVHKIDIPRYLAWLTADTTIESLEAQADRFSTGEAQAIFSDNNYFQTHKMANSYRVKEQVYAAYLQSISEFELARMPLQIVAGLRYSQTNINIWGINHLLADITLVDGELESVPLTAAQQQIQQTQSDYHAWLPSLTAALTVKDNMILRVAASKTLARPSLDDLAPWVSIEENTLAAQTASAGNPALTPYLSNNFDMSLEWYYSQASMLSVAFFNKYIKDWVVLSAEEEQLNLASDNYSHFLITRPRNIEDVDIYGVELNWSHSFENGFGFQSNATFVGSDNSLASNDSFSIEGLSDSANVVAFYENNKVQIRLAYNIREAFLQHHFWQGSPEPMYVGRYKQLDISGSYYFNDMFSAYFEGINILDEKTHKYGRYQSQFLEYSETQPRYALGLRVIF